MAAACTEIMGERLKEFIADTEMASEAYGKMIDGFANTGFSGLDAKLKKGALLMNSNALRQAKDATDAKVSALDGRDQAEIDRLNGTRGGGTDFAVDQAVDAIKRQMEARDKASSALDEAYDKASVENDIKVRENELERQKSALTTVYQDSSRQTESGLSRFDIGRSEGGKLATRTSAAMSGLEADLLNQNLGGGNATRDVAELAAMTERMKQSKEGLLSMEDRMNRALAERVNLESEIAEQNKKQNEEASRRLAMASREDQLRSAAAAAVLRGRGQSQFSMDEFQFFSQETRSAISGYKPGMVKGLDESETDQAERRSNLDREIGGLAISLKSLRERFEGLLPRAQGKAGGLLGLENPFGKSGPSATDIIDPNKENVRMNLNLGALNIDLDISRHLPFLRQQIGGDVQAAMDAAIANLRRDLTRNTAPNTAPAAAAW